VQAGAGAADLAGEQRERDQAAGVVGAVDVLADAHAPEDDRGLGAGVEAGHLAKGRGRDAADRLHGLRREVLHVGGERLEIGGVGLDVLPVVELLLHDGVDHRVQHRDVAAGLELQHVGGVPHERGAARIHHDELGAALGGVLEEGRGHGVVLGRVGADHHDDLGVRRRHEGAETAPDPTPSSSPATDEAWHRRVQWSTLFVPKPARTSFWKR
jgi:hypothetical protein